MSRIYRPSPRWIGPIAVSDTGHPGIRWVAIAPGCDYQPHDSTECGCRRFDNSDDATRYIRDQRRRHEQRR